MNTKFLSWMDEVVRVASTDYQHILCRTAKLADFNLKEFYTYYNEGFSPKDALDDSLAKTTGVEQQKRNTIQ